MSWLADLIAALRRRWERILERLRAFDWRFDRGGGNGNGNGEGIPIDELDLQDRRDFISPPIVVEPLYQCAPNVIVRGFIMHADVEVRVDGVVDAAEEGLNPDGQSFALPSELVAGEQVDARQHFDGAVSDWTTPVTVRDHTDEFPAGPPRPEIYPPPLHECGSSTAVRNLINGCNVRISADGVEVGGENGAGQWQAVHINPDFGLSQKVIARASMCDDTSAPSRPEFTIAGPSPLPVPGFGDAYDSGERIVVDNLAHGARFTVWRDGVFYREGRASISSAAIRLDPPMTDGEVLTAQQQLCAGDPPSGTGTTTVQPCSALPAPEVATIQAGDEVVRIIEMAPGARIKVFIDGVEAGDGGGSLIQLDSPVPDGATVHVQQILGACEGSTVSVAPVRCVAPRVTGDPASYDLFPVGSDDFDAGTTSVDGLTFRVFGSVRYPANGDGVGQPFNERLADTGRVPIIFLVHGRHGAFRDPDEPIDPVTGEENHRCGNPGGWVEVPNHEGYVYFQEQLARMGFVVVSVNMNDTCPQPLGSSANIHHRARVLNEAIRHFQSLDTSGDPVFGGRIDFDRVGLMGHSRGGEAVLRALDQSPPANSRVRAVLSLAPVDFGTTSGAPSGFAFMTILPAGDGDVVDNDGARFYDQAVPEPFKAQQYIDGAGHNPFNRQWLVDDGNGIFHLSRWTTSTSSRRTAACSSARRCWPTTDAATPGRHRTAQPRPARPGAPQLRVAGPARRRSPRGRERDRERDREELARPGHLPERWSDRRRVPVHPGRRRNLQPHVLREHHGDGGAVRGAPG